MPIVYLPFLLLNLHLIGLTARVLAEWRVYPREIPKQKSGEGRGTFKSLYLVPVLLDSDGDGHQDTKDNVRLFATPWTAACLAPLSFTISQFA